MQEQTNIQQDVRMWLLGLVSQEQRESLEQHLITDARAFDEISMVEDDLIDEYLSGELSEKESAAFESFFMNSSERQQQFRVAKAWRSYVERERSEDEVEVLPPVPEPPPGFLASLSAYRVPIAAALSILVVAAVWIFFKSSPGTGGPSLAVFLEPAIQTREGGTLQPVNVPGNIKVVELHAKLPKGQSKTYRATLFDANGNTVLTSDSPTVDTSGPEIDVVVVPVPAARLTRGQYKLQLDIPHPDGRSESAASYHFEIVTS